MPKTKNYDRIISLKLDSQRFDALHEYAHEYEERSMSEIIRELIDERLAQPRTNQTI